MLGAGDWITSSCSRAGGAWGWQAAQHLFVGISSLGTPTRVLRGCEVALVQCSDLCAASSFLTELLLAVLRVAMGGEVFDILLPGLYSSKLQGQILFCGLGNKSG